MNIPIVSMIVALGKETRVIGKGNELIWRIGSDLKRFKQLTMNHPIIMGRKTYESIGRPLPGRTSIVISRNANFAPAGVVVVPSPEDALAYARTIESQEIFIIGGGEIYKQLLPATSRLYLTLIESDEQGDTYFPPYDNFTKKISEEHHTEHTPPFKWLTLERE
ncbi:MAG: dihydrofolate reductase [Candidatus Paceibacterota bacterium]